MPLLSKHFDAYLFSPPSAARVEMQIRWKDYYKRIKIATATPFILTGVFSKYLGKRKHFKHHISEIFKILIGMLIGNEGNKLVNSVVYRDQFLSQGQA